MLIYLCSTNDHCWLFHVERLAFVDKWKTLWANSMFHVKPFLKVE
jgi:hypothetical protein